MSASEFILDRKSPTALREAAQGCRGCHLHEAAGIDRDTVYVPNVVKHASDLRAVAESV